jgi:hypothetical protein
VHYKERGLPITSLDVLLIAQRGRTRHGHESPSYEAAVAGSSKERI